MSVASSMLAAVAIAVISGCSGGGEALPPPGKLSIASTSLSSGQVSTAYSATLAAAGGTPPYRWSVSSGALPAGLTLAAATGVISGTPTTTENAEAVTLQVSDSGTPRQSSSQTLRLTISPATLRLATSSLPSGQVSIAYSATLAASGGTPPYQWSVSSGALPPGLTLAAATGVISGTPATAENAVAVTLQVSDSGTPHQSTSHSLGVTISPMMLRVATTSLPSGQVSAAYSATLAASGGTPPFRWSVSSGALPPGLTLAAATGVISGTPTTAEDVKTVTIQVSDAWTPRQSSSQSLSVAISPPTLLITTTSLPSGQVGTAYNATLAASGGTPPYQWSVSSGALPPGLTLAAATGVISGTPTRTEIAEAVTVQVSDAGTPRQSSSHLLSAMISPATLRVTTTSLPSGQVGSAYTATLAASGGTPPYQWSVWGGALPPGLTLAAATGVISGSPTMAENAEAVTLQVSDSGTPRQSSSQSLGVTISPTKLRVATTSLPAGKVGSPYSSMLGASGGTPPYQWSISSGTLPMGLTLASTGVISGTPAAAANAIPVTFEVADSGTPAQIGYTPGALTVNPENITVSIAPAGAALTVTQVATLAATTNDFAGVSWSISPSGGGLSSTQSLNSVPIQLTAPGAAGVYLLTATSVTDPTQSASIPVAVTDLAGVFTYHNDLARDGVNGQEYALTPSNVAAGFGKIFSCTVDGAVYSQPLWVANLTVGGAQHNVVFIATAHDSLFAFDADASPCVKLWQVSLIDAAHGATPGETTVPSGPAGYLVGNGSGDITPEVGVIGTPVIDSASGTLYVVSKSTVTVFGTPLFYQRLHAIDPTTGLEKASSPVVIQGSYPGSGDGASMDTWSARQQNQRAGLVFVNGTVYIAWGSHEDEPPYYGWIMGYRYGASGFTQVAVFNVTPNVQYGGIWMSGAAPSADSSGNLYLVTGNGGFDVTNTSPPNNDYGDSFLELSINASSASPQSAAFSISQWFTPSDQQTDDADDLDFGSSGAVVLADVVAGNPPATVHLVVGGGKDGNLYVLDRDRLGGYGDVNAWEEIGTGYELYSTAAFWNDTIYVAPAVGPLTSYSLTTSGTSVEFQLEYVATSPTGGYGWPGATPSVSASGTTNAIIWALDSGLYCTNRSHGCGSAVLHAYDPANQLNEIWNSSLAADGADAAGNAVKFTVPTIANGKVYVGSRGNNTGGATASTAIPGELDVYGLKSN
jgi:Putative Ig domain